jgi:serine/threonine protein kinase
MQKFTPEQLIDNRYRIKENIGKGGFADVFRAEDTITSNTEVAIKILAPQSGLSSAVRRSYINEFTNTLELSHQFLLTPKHYGEYGETCYIVMPLCRNGSLDNCILESNNSATQNNLARMLYFDGVEMKDAPHERIIAQVLNHTASALDYIHNNGLTHNDIKPGNILIGNNGDYLLSDFGISSKTRMTAVKNSVDRSKIEVEEKKTNSALSIAYAATELFGDYPMNTAKTDIFSLGVTMYEIATGNLPWLGQGGIVLNRGASIPNLSDKYSNQLNKIIRRCMDAVPENRPTTLELSKWSKFYLENGYWDVDPVPPLPDPSPKKTNKKWLKATLIGILGALSILAFWFFKQHIDKDKPDVTLSTFSFTPTVPVEGALKGVIELGATGFNSFIVTIDGNKNWKLEKADFGSSLVYEKLTTFEDVKMGVKNYIADLLAFGVRPQNIHFVVSSGAIKEDIVKKIKEELIKQGYYVNAVTPEQEAALALKCVLPKEYKENAFVVDIGSANTKISFLKGDEVVGLETFGAKYFQKGNTDAEVYSDVSQKVSTIPKNKAKTCFIIGGVPYELAKQIRNGKERFTVLKFPNDYTPEGDKQKAGLNIYKAIADKTGCKQFVFDWDANFTIGFLLSN